MPAIRLGDLTIDVVLKDIRNVHLSVHPPTGHVRIAAPERMSLETIRVYAASRLPWIRQQQKKLRAQEREPAREYIERESHYVWGRRYLLRIAPTEGRPFVELTPRRLVLGIRPGASAASRERALQRWYRDEIRRVAHPLIRKWEHVMGVGPSRLFVQQMKTKWGSCNGRARTIRLNTEVAKKPPACLEYLIVHELAHLQEPTHNARFVELIDQYLPRWRNDRETLNRLPVREESWTY